MALRIGSLSLSCIIYVSAIDILGTSFIYPKADYKITIQLLNLTIVGYVRIPWILNQVYTSMNVEIKSDTSIQSK